MCSIYEACHASRRAPPSVRDLVLDVLYYIVERRRPLVVGVLHAREHEGPGLPVAQARLHVKGHKGGSRGESAKNKLLRTDSRGPPHLQPRGEAPEGLAPPEAGEARGAHSGKEREDGLRVVPRDDVPEQQQEQQRKRRGTAGWQRELNLTAKKEQASPLRSQAPEAEVRGRPPVPPRVKELRLDRE